MVAKIASIDARSLTAREFHNDVVSVGMPLVLRGAVIDWPATQAGLNSPQALADYLMSFDRGQRMRAMIGPPTIKGRFFYNDALSGFNFRTETIRLDAALDQLLNSATEAQPSALAIQSLPLWGGLPNFAHENSMPLLPATVEPRAWLGNRVTIAAHHDPSENLACVVAGQRRFTLFPPDQVANLYPGPFELTPAGPTISMVDFDQPDLDRYPNFQRALDKVLVADLVPGDAIYIPYLWWHHVRSTASFNLLVNYWWAPFASTRGHPLEAMIHAMSSIRGLPKNARDAWQVMFEHYVFSDHAIADHLPPDRQGIQHSPVDPASLAWAYELLSARFRKP